MIGLSKDIVGKKLEPFEFLVERGKAREFALAIGETNEIYFNVEAAKAAGFSDTPVPLTFQTAFTFWGYPKFWSDLEALGIDIKKLLHLKEEYAYHSPIYPGVKVHCGLQVEDVKIGKMNIVTFKGVFANEKGEPYIESQMAIVIRPD